MTLKLAILIAESLLELLLKISRMIGFVLFVVPQRILSVLFDSSVVLL
jgi:hypothetical protein